MLFKTLPEIQEYLAVGAGTDINQLKPHILNAETAYIRPLLGSSLFDQLQEFYNEPNRGSGSGDISVEAYANLLAKVQKSLIHLAYWMGFQALNATISSLGFKRTESTTVKSLYHYQEDELKDYFKTAGFNGLDEVLEYIESNINDFDDFDMSPTWTVMKSAFIPDTKTFDKIIFINNSRLTFLRLKSYFGLIEDMEIHTILGTVIFEEIKAEMVMDSPAGKVLSILPYIQKPIAFLSTSMLMEESGADLTEKGLYFESLTANKDSIINKKPSDASSIAVLYARNRSLGNAYLDQLKSYLVAHISDWPSYSGQIGSVYNRDNAMKKTFWG